MGYTMGSVACPGSGVCLAVLAAAVSCLPPTATATEGGAPWCAEFTPLAPVASTGRTCQAELDALLGLGLPGLDSTVVSLSPTVCRVPTPLLGGHTVASSIEAIGGVCCGGDGAINSPCAANPCASPGDYDPTTTIGGYCVGGEVAIEAGCDTAGGEWSGSACVLGGGDNDRCDALGGTARNVTCGDMTGMLPGEVCALSLAACATNVLGMSATASELLATIEASGCCGARGSSHVCGSGGGGAVAGDCPAPASTTTSPTRGPTQAPTVPVPLPAFGPSAIRKYFAGDR